MQDRVLSTMTARESIHLLNQLLSDYFFEQLKLIGQTGQTLSDPNVWDGQLAVEFRSSWPHTHATLNTAVDALEDLQREVRRYENQMMHAGGIN